MRAAFFDIDGTLTNDRTWKGLVGYFQEHKQQRGIHLLYMLRHYPLYILFRLKLVSMASVRKTWAGNLAWYLRGYSPQESEAVWDWIVVNFFNHHWRADVREQLKTHIRNGDLVMLVSSAPQPMVGRIARELGAENGIGTSLEVRSGRYTGRCKQPVCIGSYKASMPQEFLNDRGIKIDFKDSYAYADSLTDLHLLEMVGHPVAVYPEDNLRQTAGQRKWQIFPE